MNKDLRDKIITKVVGGLVIVSLAVILATLQMELFPNVDWSEVDTTPLYWPETFEPYPEPPEDYYEEWHGKEGKSEYGEYEFNDTWDQGPCGDINDSL